VDAPVRLIAVLAALLALAGCAGGPSAPAPAYNGTDVMFLQMAVEQITEGDRVAALAAERGTGDVRALAAELREQWARESGTMRRWLTGWEQPLAADPDAGAHAGHGDLHALRDADLAELAAAQGEQFDRTAVGLLLGHLHNCVETSRMEAAGGVYPPAKALAQSSTASRQGQIRRLLALAA